jgi:hypothetical protein
MADAEGELARLRDEAPLSPAWNPIELFAEIVELAGLELFLVGLSATCGKTGSVVGSVVGSAAEAGAHPARRAYFELLERSAVLDCIAQPDALYPLLSATGEQIGERGTRVVFPEAGEYESWAYAKSNGVAVGPDWTSACEHARAELVERHCVLCSWYGFSEPLAIEHLQDASLTALGGLYEFECYAFPAPGEPSHEVVGVFGFPRTASSPLIYGFGADECRSGALERARRECLQRLAFLWGEAIPTREPPFGKTPNYHQESFLWPPMHARLRAWLRGDHVGRATRAPALAAATAAAGFVDLTPPHLLRGGGAHPRVAKALPTFELQLTFGRGHPSVVIADAALAVHPVA